MHACINYSYVQVDKLLNACASVLKLYEVTCSVMALIKSLLYHWCTDVGQVFFFHMIFEWLKWDSSPEKDYIKNLGSFTQFDRLFHFGSLSFGIFSIVISKYTLGEIFKKITGLCISEDEFSSFQANLSQITCSDQQTPAMKNDKSSTESDSFLLL